MKLFAKRTLPPSLDCGPWITKALTTAGGHLFLHSKGYTLFFDKGSTLTGYDCDVMKEACARAGLPIIDSRALSRNEALEAAFSAPVAAVGVSPTTQPYHSLSIAPIEIVAAHYRAAGATILNLTVEPATPLAAPASSPSRMSKRRRSARVMTATK